MKTNFHNEIVVCFDLHDTLLFSQNAWLEAFKIITKGDDEKYQTIKKEYLEGGWKREICKKFGYQYDEVKDIYLTIVEPMEEVKKFCEEMQKKHRVFIITNATYKRAIEDIKVLKMEFEKVYSRDDGKKPDPEYIKKILEQNDIHNMIMVGNETVRDIFNLPNTKSIIVNQNTQYKDLIKEYKKIISEINL
ncbi:MAG: HAD-IA family hydrolase [Clostridia bacterium]|nr:HAD-IA family hydrolase [Clostridia bacterium]